jgi:hypothetical protein
LRTRSKDPQSKPDVNPSVRRLTKNVYRVAASVARNGGGNRLASSVIRHAGEADASSGDTRFRVLIGTPRNHHHISFGKHLSCLGGEEHAVMPLLALRAHEQ